MLAFKGRVEAVGLYLCSTDTLCFSFVCFVKGSSLLGVPGFLWYLLVTSGTLYSPSNRISTTT